MFQIANAAKIVQNAHFLSTIPTNQQLINNNQRLITYNMRNATIVVIGDIGHSPRTCNHAFSLASHGLKVNIVGYLNSKPHPKIINHENIRLIFILFLIPLILEFPQFHNLLHFYQTIIKFYVSCYYL
ncbi:unnamed protein product [Meloidogyne enterolobii]|uniref:Uncharacterized protein n=2 Tax=Meloidogyne enterolobii TaxID=390850 RepID=A0ACB1B9A3_MELEN